MSRKWIALFFHEHVATKTRGLIDGLDEKRRQEHREMTKIDLYFERLLKVILRRLRSLRKSSSLCVSSDVV